MKMAKIIGTNVGMHVGPTSLAAGDWRLATILFIEGRKKRVQEKMGGGGGIY